MGFFFAFMTALGFASSNVVVRKGMRPGCKDNGVLTTVMVNVVFLGCAWLIYRTFFNQVTFNWLGLGVFVIAGLLTTFIGRTSLFIAFRHIGPSRGSAIKNSAPVFTVVFAVMLLGESLSWQSVWGIGFVLLGLLVQGWYMIRHSEPEIKPTTVLAEQQTNRQDTNLATKQEVQPNSLIRYGYIMALITALAFGVGQGVRKIGVDLMPDPFFGAFVSAVVAVTMTILLEWRKGVLLEKLLEQKNNLNWYFILGGIFTSIGMVSFFLAAMYIKVAYVSAIIALEPILTIIISAVLLRKLEIIPRYTVVAALLIVAGAMTIVLAG